MSRSISQPIEISTMPRRVERVSVVRDYSSLTKPRITVMILITTVVAMVVCPQANLTLWKIINTLVATALFAASASVLNQWFEQEQDALMDRTKNRPLPSGRLSSLETSVFGWILLLLGTGWFLVSVGVVPWLVGMATWGGYVWIYTPMKQLSWWNTAVGTIPGALPVMIGWTAAGGSISDWRGWVLTGVVVFWQFPHFMAIAWLYRKQYQAAGYKMLTSVEPTGVAAGWHALVGAGLLIPVSVLCMVPDSLLSWTLAGLSVLVASYQMGYAVRFFRDRTDLTARSLLRCSLLYLPATLLLVVVRFISV